MEVEMKGGMYVDKSKKKIFVPYADGEVARRKYFATTDLHAALAFNAEHTKAISMDAPSSTEAGTSSSAPLQLALRD